MADYNEYELKRIQEISLEMAKFFVNYCEEHNLLCYFCGGGCIGAVRNKGFIPWDDDLDFFMPRDDYERLKNEWIDTDKYVLSFPTKKYNDHSMFVALKDRDTTMIRPFQADLDIVHGITIDIFPLDGCPRGKLARHAQIFWGLVYQIFCTQWVPTNHGILKALIGKIILGLFRSKNLRYFIWHMAEKKMSRWPISECDYLTEICAGPKYMYNEYPKEAFCDALFVDFEDTKMPIPIGYDAYLKMAFGNYMQLPPVEQRKPSHESFIDTENSYIKYKGIHYCID